MRPHPFHDIDKFLEFSRLVPTRIVDMDVIKLHSYHQKNPVVSAEVYKKTMLVLAVTCMMTRYDIVIELKTYGIRYESRIFSLSRCAFRHFAM